VALRTGLYAFAALILWVNANRFWPSDREASEEVPMSMKLWMKLAFLVLGLYLLAPVAPITLMTLVKSTLQTSMKWPEIEPYVVFRDCFMSLFALALIAYGAVGWTALSRAEPLEE